MESTPITKQDPPRETGPSKAMMYTCKACETPKPRTKEYFAPHAKTGDGLHTTCRDCIRQLIEQGRKKHKQTVSTKRKGKSSSGSASKNPPTKKDRKRIKRELNFYGHEDLMKAIEKDAAVQFRAFNAHVLFILRSHIDQQKTGIVS